MPRSRGSELPPLKHSPRRPNSLRTSTSSDSEPTHHRPVTVRSPKKLECRSPRGAQTDAPGQKKLGTRIADLESQLGQAQQELKNLKGQLVSAEAAKKEAEEQLETRAKEPDTAKGEIHLDEVSDLNQREIDVFEVQIGRVSVDYNKVELSQLTDEQSSVPEEQKPPPSDPLTSKNREIISLQYKLQEKEKEVESFRGENETLKKELIEVSSEISSMATRLVQMGEELEASIKHSALMNEKLVGAERAKDGLEGEMKKLKIQTEQWRKAADAAAAVLAGDADTKGQRIPARSVSMEKHVEGKFGNPAGGFARLPVAGEKDDGYGGGRRGSGIRVLGDLWKKKGHK